MPKFKVYVREIWDAEYLVEGQDGQDAIDQVDQELAQCQPGDTPTGIMCARRRFQQMHPEPRWSAYLESEDPLL